MLSIKNQNALRALARPKMINGNINPEFGLVNQPLNELIDQIMSEERHKFLRPSDLAERVFVDEPKSAILCKGFVRPYVRLAREG